MGALWLRFLRGNGLHNVFFAAEASHQEPDADVPAARQCARQWWTSCCGVEIPVCDKDGKWDLCSPLQNGFSSGNWRLSVRIIPTTPSLNYWSSFNLISMVTQLHAASCKLAAVQRSMSTVMTKSQLDLHLVFAVPTLSILACMPQKKKQPGIRI